MKLKTLILATAAIGSLAAGAARSAPPEPVYQALVKIGRIVDAPGTTALYGPILKDQSYAGATFTRALHYGPEPRAVLDVAAPTARARSLPVMIYVPGGGGNNHLDYEGGGPFLDNIMLAAVRHGMVGVLMQRRAGPGAEWDSGAKDISAVVQWVHDHIGEYGGDPARVVIWGQSAGANNLSNYLSHADYWPKAGVGVKGAVLMSGGYNLAPMRNAATNSAPQGPGDGGAAAIRAAGAAPAAPRPAGPTPEMLLARSTLPGFKTLPIKLYVTAAELDPETTVEASKMLQGVLCDAGRCPAYTVFPKQSHMSEVLGINSPDKDVETPLFDWARKTAG